MKFELRLKTGVYETSSYFVLVRDNQLILLPVFPNISEEVITLLGDELINVTVNSMNAEVEIKTKDKILTGTLIISGDADSLFHALKSELNTTVRYVSEPVKYPALKT